MPSTGPSSSPHRHAKFLAAFAAGLVVAGLALRLLDAGAATDDRPAPTPGVRAPEPEQAADVEVAALAALARRVNALEGGRRRQGAPDPPAAGPARSEDQPVEEEPVSDEERLAAEEERIERRFAFLSDQLRAEPVDRAWAAEATAAIEHAANDFPGTIVRRLDCRTTLCELEVEHPDQLTSDRFLDYFFPQVPSLPRGTLHRLEATDGRPRSLVILAREGHALPRLQEQVEQ